MVFVKQNFDPKGPKVPEQMKTVATKWNGLADTEKVKLGKEYEKEKVKFTKAMDWWQKKLNEEDVKMLESLQKSIAELSQKIKTSSSKGPGK